MTTRVRNVFIWTVNLTHACERLAGSWYVMCGDDGTWRDTSIIFFHKLGLGFFSVFMCFCYYIILFFNFSFSLTVVILSPKSDKNIIEYYRVKGYYKRDEIYVRCVCSIGSWLLDNGLVKIDFGLFFSTIKLSITTV